MLARWNKTLSALALLTGTVWTGCTSTLDSAPASTGQAGFSTVAECAHCHVRIAKQHSESMHAKSFTNPVFQGLYYEDYLAGLHEDPEAFRKEPACLSCHAPIANMRHRYVGAKHRSDVMVAGDDCGSCHPASKVEVNASREGVVCDVCHRIKSFKGDAPGNGNYVATPGQPKYGPIKSDNDWHHAYNELQTKSEFCAMCHSSTNRYGLKIRTTFEEWRESRFAREGIQCQDCHMNLQGYLSDGKPVFESGRAATMTLGQAPEREQLHTHRFFGAHSRSQIKGALSLDLDVLWPQVRSGTNVPVQVAIHNEKTGHRMPTGSAELRVVWLDVVARVSGLEIPLQYGGDLSTYNVSGGPGADAAVFGDQVPPGRRLFQAVFVDESGRRTFRSYNAVRRVFDNRMAAGEVRREPYYLKVPRGATGDIELEATLFYLRYPAVFSQRLGLPETKPVPFAKVTKRMTISD